MKQFLFKNHIFLSQKFKIIVCSDNVVSENEGVSDNTSESVYLISVEAWLYKALKNQKNWCLLHGWKLEI